MSAVTWVIKASKFCNLRCRYCYEWEELGHRARISFEQWHKLLQAARRYAERQRRRLAEPVQTRIIWHGGEPILLPLPYFKAVHALECEVFGPEAVARGEIVNFIQTNLSLLPEDKLDFLAQANFGLWFSLDWVPGIRLDRPGEETEKATANNLRRVLERGLKAFGVTVLAGHTRAYLREIHDNYEALSTDFRVLPLFDAPNVTPASPFFISNEDVISSLTDLFVHWFERGRRVRVFPLEDHLTTALFRVTGLKRLVYARSQFGENVFVVNTDGTLYAQGERYIGGYALGNLFEQSIDEIVESSAYTASLRRNGELLARHCEQCPMSGACDGLPVQTHPNRWPEGPCPVASHVCAFIEDYLREEGADGTMIGELNPLSRQAGTEEVAAIDL
jgi:uncharacterized protein